jgi:hypothetical protein
MISIVLDVCCSICVEKWKSNFSHFSLNDKGKHFGKQIKEAQKKTS